MRTKVQLLSSVLFSLSYIRILHVAAQSSIEPAQGYTCTPNRTALPCQAYAFYRATAPDFLNLASIGDLFAVSRLMISKPSNISSPSSPLFPNQPLFIPLSCSCNTINATFSISFANLSYTINGGDTFYLVSTNKFKNLTTYQSVEIVNPTLVPTQLQIGVNVFFPIFCKCPNQTQLQNRVNYLISYLFQPSDNLSEVASFVGAETLSVIDVNSNNIQPSDTIFIPVNQLPQLAKPAVVPSVSGGKSERKGMIPGLAIGLGIIGGLLFLVIGVWVYRGYVEEEEEDGER